MWYIKFEFSVTVHFGLWKKHHLLATIKQQSESVFKRCVQDLGVTCPSIIHWHSKLNYKLSQTHPCSLRYFWSCAIKLHVSVNSFILPRLIVKCEMFGIKKNRMDLPLINPHGIIKQLMLFWRSDFEC